MKSENYPKYYIGIVVIAIALDDHESARVHVCRRLLVSGSKAKQITTGLVLMRWNLCNQKAAKRWTPADVWAAEVPGRKAKGGRLSLLGLSRLQPIPKVSLYKIAHYCRFNPDMPPAGTRRSQPTASRHRQSGDMEQRRRGDEAVLHKERK